MSNDTRDEERKAAELVIQQCKNCEYNSALKKVCLHCSAIHGANFSDTPFNSAIDAKVEELITKEPVGIQAVIENGTVFTCGSLSCLLDTPSVGTNSHCRCLSGLDFADKLKVGRYIQREKALKKEMLGVLKDLVKWGKDYPSHRIYCESAIKKIAKEIDVICEDAEKLIKKVEGK
jgi:hypothetical protein